MTRFWGCQSSTLRPQEGPEGSQGPPRALRRPPEAPRSAEGSSCEPPGGRQGSSQEFPMTPLRLPGGPQRLQGLPKTAQTTPQEAQGPSKTLKRALQDTLGTPSSLEIQPPGGPRSWTNTCFCIPLWLGRPMQSQYIYIYIYIHTIIYIYIYIH